MEEACRCSWCVLEGGVGVPDASWGCLPQSKCSRRRNPAIIQLTMKPCLRSSDLPVNHCQNALARHAAQTDKGTVARHPASQKAFRSQQGHAEAAAAIQEGPAGAAIQEGPAGAASQRRAGEAASRSEGGASAFCAASPCDEGVSGEVGASAFCAASPSEEGASGEAGASAFCAANLPGGDPSGGEATCACC